MDNLTNFRQTEFSKINAALNCTSKDCGPYSPYEWLCDHIRETMAARRAGHEAGRNEEPWMYPFGRKVR
jgi:hypothetical protein